MKQLLVKKGRLTVEEEPIPVAGDNEVLVKVDYSLVSTGTELSSVKKRQNVLLEAIHDKKLVEKFKKLISQRGLFEAFKVARTKIEEPALLGYSNAGVAVQVGKNVAHIKAGDPVACAGAGYALHAGFAIVPKNLAVKIPTNIDKLQACFAGVGAIALQAVRRADPKIGETIVVYGLGLVGVLTAKILQLNGAKVIGVDISHEKLQKAKRLGIPCVKGNVNDQLEKIVFNLTAQNGADAVILTAASPSSELVNNAIKLCRRKGKVVIVGDVGLNLDREELYKRELDVLISTSYGPGRYDANYEQKGVDYPFAYVRWTQQRNLAAFIELLDRGLNVEKLVDEVAEIDNALKAFEQLKQGKINVLVIKYPHESAQMQRGLQLKPIHAMHGKVNVCLLGPGNFAKSTLIPAIAKIGDLHVTTVASGQPVNAKYVAELCRAAKCFSDYKEALADKTTDAVVITTRHSSHAGLVLDALESEKHVFVEKPLALNENELTKIEHMVSKHNRVLLVGHNRRYSPALHTVKQFLSGSNLPKIINYRVRADALPIDHFLNDPGQGGRIIGEMVHFFDVFTFLCDGEITRVNAASSGYENVVVNVEFSDGSLCNLVYTTAGSTKLEKERIEIFSGEATIVIDDFASATVTNTHGKKTLYSGRQDKGHTAEMQFFADAVKGKQDASVNLTDAISATRIAFKVLEKLKTY